MPYRNLTTNLQNLLRYPEFPRTDVHCHTVYSDGCVTLHQLVKHAQKLHLSIVTKSDHNTLKGNSQLKTMAQAAGLLFIPAIEISIKNNHMLGINVESWPYGTGLEIDDCIDKLHDMNALAILAHPWWRGMKGLRDHVFEYAHLDGIEVLNSASPIGGFDFIRRLYATSTFDKLNEHRIPCWVGSDSHGGYAYGQYQMQFHTVDLQLMQF